jgi:hypothetical protein
MLQKLRALVFGLPLWIALVVCGGLPAQFLYLPVVLC